MDSAHLANILIPQLFLQRCNQLYQVMLKIIRLEAKDQRSSSFRSQPIT